MKYLRSVQSYRDRQTVWMSITAGLAVLAVALLLWAGAGSTPAIASPPAAPETAALSNGSVITIGVASTLSVAPQLGQRQANAVQLAVDQVNAAGGIDIGGTNYTLALVTADSGCNPTQAAVAANTLLSAGVVAVVKTKRGARPSDVTPIQAPCLTSRGGALESARVVGATRTPSILAPCGRPKE